MYREPKKSCALLGTYSSVWSKDEPLPALGVVTASVDSFQSAIKLAVEGDCERACKAITRIDGALIRERYIEHAQTTQMMGPLKPPPELWRSCCSGGTDGVRAVSVISGWIR